MAQKLYKANQEAALVIMQELKRTLCMPNKRFVHIFVSMRQIGKKPLGRRAFFPSSGEITSGNNWQTTKYFLLQNGLMTITYVNGFTIYVATKKLLHTQGQNLKKFF